MNGKIDFTDADLRRFSPRISPVYVRGLMEGKGALAQRGILDSGSRFCHWMGQFGAETQGGKHVRENLNYSSVQRIKEVWPARARKETTAALNKLVRNPVALANWAYGDRLGNRKGTNDGYDFRGGGFLQITGRKNVEHHCALACIPIRPDILDDPDATLKFACAYWQNAGCNELADANDILGISRAINLGSSTSSAMPNGMDHRHEWFERAKAIWWDAVPVAEAAPEPAPAPSEVPSPPPAEETAPPPTTPRDAHAEAHSLLRSTSWSYYLNRLNLKTLALSAAGVFAFVKEHALEIGGALLLAVILFELWQYHQRKKVIGNV